MSVKGAPGDKNLNLLHYDQDDVQKCLKTLLSFKFHSKTCIDHIFIKSDSNTHLTSCIETVSPEGTFCDTVQVPSNGGDMELI